MGEYAEAIPLCERVLAIQEQCLDQDHPARAQTLHDLLTEAAIGRERKGATIPR
jgi:hypothetical protein